MPSPHARQLPLFLIILAATCGAATPLPSPGNYRIDGEARMRSGSGPTLAERIERWDGSNGNRVVTTMAGGRSHQQSYIGSEPVTWCVSGVSVSPNQMPDRCKTRWWPAQSGAELQAECQAGRLQDHWKQIDTKTWERQMTFTPVPGGGGSDPAAALAMVEKGLPPAEAAKARAAVAALPSAQPTRRCDGTGLREDRGHHPQRHATAGRRGAPAIGCAASRPGRRWRRGLDDDADRALDPHCRRLHAAAKSLDRTLRAALSKRAAQRRP